VPVVAQLTHVKLTDADLQIRAAYLSEDDRAERFREQRPHGPAVVGKASAKSLSH